MTGTSARSVMRDEISQQPAIVAALAGEVEPFRAAAAAARAAGVRFVLYAARGTSDNAAVYGKYLATIAGLPAGLAVPSAATVYKAAIDFRDCLVLGISQSGETPDVAEYVAHARAAGALTLAITNDESSTLARSARHVLPTKAGTERAVAATKTYTSQLAALALFWAAWARDDAPVAALHEEVPRAMSAALELEALIAEVASRLSHADRLLVTARGYNYATALETALKVAETCYVPALPLSGADLRHGPIALVESRYPVLLYAMQGATYAGMVELHRDLCARGAETYVITDGDDELPGAAAVLRLPAAPEALSPLVAVVPGQLFAMYLAVARGLDPDHPRALSKVTRTY
jgi:glucosamine--fructose-6-phosphate aminotransferase (isomerizing)